MKKLGRLFLILVMVISCFPISGVSKHLANELEIPSVTNNEETSLETQVSQDEVFIEANNLVVENNQVLLVSDVVANATVNGLNDESLIVNEEQLNRINNSVDGGIFDLTISKDSVSTTIKVVKLGNKVSGVYPNYIVANDLVYSEEQFEQIVANNDTQTLVDDARAKVIDIATGVVNSDLTATINGNTVTFTNGIVSKDVNVTINQQLSVQANNKSVEEKESRTTQEVKPITVSNTVLTSTEAQNTIATVEDIKTVMGVTDVDGTITVNVGTNFNKIKNGAINYDGYDVTFDNGSEQVGKKLYIVEEDVTTISSDKKSFVRMYDTYGNVQSVKIFENGQMTNSITIDGFETEEEFYNYNYTLVVDDGKVINYGDNKINISGFDDVYALASVAESGTVNHSVTYKTNSGEELSNSKQFEVLKQFVQESKFLSQPFGPKATNDHLGKLYFGNDSYTLMKYMINETFTSGSSVEKVMRDSFNPHFIHRGINYDEEVVLNLSDEQRQEILNATVSSRGYPVGWLASVPNTDYPLGSADANSNLVIGKGQKPDGYEDTGKIIVYAKNYVDKESEAVNSKEELINRMQVEVYDTGLTKDDIKVTISDEQGFNKKEQGDYEVTFSCINKKGETGEVKVTYSIVSDDSYVTENHLGYIYVPERDQFVHQDSVNVNTRKDIMDMLSIKILYDGNPLQSDINILNGSVYDVKERELGSYKYQIEVGKEGQINYMFLGGVFTIYDDQTDIINGYAIRADNILIHESELPLTDQQAITLARAKAWKVDGTNNNVPLIVNLEQLSQINSRGEFPLEFIVEEQQTEAETPVTRLGTGTKVASKEIKVTVVGEDVIVPQVASEATPQPSTPETSTPTGVVNNVLFLTTLLAVSVIVMVTRKRNN